MKTSIVIIAVIFAFTSRAQDWQLVHTIDLKKTIASFSLDGEGKIYLGTAQGDLYRYLVSGVEDIHFSDIANSPVTTVEAWNRMKIFLFFRDIQKVSLLDRFTTTPANYELHSFQSDLAWLTAPGQDNSIWVLSSTYNELRKYNIQTKELILATPLSISLKNARHLQTYQNLVIISDEAEGLYLFDQYGNYLDSLKLAGIRHFYLQKGKLTALVKDEIISLDPFDLKASYETIKAPSGAFNGVLISRDFFFFIQKTSVKVYQKKS